MSERVEKWHGLSIRWPRPPRTLKGAMYRLEEMGQAIFWMKSDLEGGEYSRSEYVKEIRHYQNILEARWAANDARLTGFDCDCGMKSCTQKTQKGGQ